MAKLAKKSATRAAATVAATQPVKKGKRESEDTIVEKSAKKQKNQLVVQQTIDTQSEKKLEEKVKVSAKNVEKEDNAPNKVAAGKNGHAASSKKGKSLADTKPIDEASDDYDSDDETGSDEDVVEVNKPSVAVAKNASLTTKEAQAELSNGSGSEYDTSSDEEVAANVPAAPSKTGTESVTKNEVESNDESESGSDCEDGTDSDENVASAKESSALAQKGNKTALKEKVELKDDEEITAKQVKPALKEVDSGEDSGSDDESSGSDDDDTDVKMTDATSTETNAGKGASMSDKAPKTPATPKEKTAGTTIFVGNLSFSVEQADVENFFKDVGEVVEVRFAMSHDNVFRGFGHVQFATQEQAAKVLNEMNGKELLGRPVKLDFARERGSYTPNSGDKEASSFKRGEGSRIQTVFIRGFDKAGGEDEIRSSLEDRFGSCGEIARLTIPKDQEGGVKGIAYIDFKDNDAFNKALELNGSEFGNDTLTVEEAKPKVDGRSGGWGGGRGSRDRFSGRGFGGHRGRNGRGGGRFEGRGRGGGRFEGRGRFGDRGGRRSFS